MTYKMTYDLLTGRSTEHLAHTSFDFPVHQALVAPLTDLINEASKAGHQIKLISGFRGHQQQSNIWNEKAYGKRALLDDNGIGLNYSELSPQEILKAILRWSAIPGASRHHWGTDIDIYCANALPTENYSVQLTPQEVADDGIFGKLHMWLDQYLPQFPFFRPYANDQGGVAPERWHLSYQPLSTQLLDQYTFDIFLKNIETSEIQLKKLLLEDAEDLYQKYVINIST